MNFDLTADQHDLQRGIRELCEKRFRTEHLRENVGRVDRDDWDALTEAGVFAIAKREDEGGLGLGLTEAMLVFEELGRALVPGPLVGTFLATVAPGRIVSIVDRDAPTVDYLDSLEALVVVDDDGVWLVDPSGVTAVAVPSPLDPLSPRHSIEELPQGELIDDREVVSRWHLEGAALTAALQLGIASRCTELAVAYAKEREQFGRLIGSFQAVKHICADMLVRAEVARAAVYAAGVALDGASETEPGRAVAGAKLLADESALRGGKDCVQVHGGMGFTWEVDVHLYLKRAVVLATQFGTAAENAETMAACL